MKAKSKKYNIICFKEYIKNFIDKYFEFTRKNLVIPFLLLCLFYSIAVLLSLLKGKVFYLINFMYIGTALATGVFLSTSLKKTYSSWGRRIPQIMIGSYMLVFIGIILNENIQIEGFFIYLFSGVFTGSVLHYMIAKIIGPLVFNRGWCGWACWTAMVLDLFPYKEPKNGRTKKLEKLRYVSFFISLFLVVFIWFVLDKKDIYSTGKTQLYWLILGNVIYYTLGIYLAIIMGDNRAFCKYLCPIAVIMKITARFSLLKIHIQKRKCINCGLCEKKCPMNIRLLDYKKQNKRVLSTECILCNTCADVCPEKAILMIMKIDGEYRGSTNKIKKYILYLALLTKDWIKKRFNKILK